MTLAALRFPPNLTFESVVRSHPGRRRSINEDRVLERTAEGLWAVADGMGGHEGGDVAASRVVAALAAVQLTGSGLSRLADIQQAMDEVNVDLLGRQTDFGSPCGSTVVALVSFENHYACLWAGDSRAYRARAGLLSAITHDHSLVQQLVDVGALDESGRKHHPSAHVITRAVGAVPRLELDRQTDQIMEGDVFLLCSDGLTNCIDDGQIAHILNTQNPVQAADHLLNRALDQGAPDNVSLVIVRAASQ